MANGAPAQPKLQNEANESRCSFCSKCFTHKQDLYKHIASHFGQNPFLCGICNKSFKCSEDLLEHMKVHLTSQCIKQEPALDIMEVEETDPLEVPQVKETSSETSKISTETYCDFCDINFVSNYNLEKHKQKYHRKQFNCGVCGYIRTKVKDMMMHLKDVHKVQNMYMCSACSLCFATMSKLKHHMLAHKKQPQKCLQCSLTFKSNAELTKHQLTHVARKAYHRCYLCSMNFPEFNHLNEHICEQHDDIHAVICDYCKHLSKDARDLRTHNLSAHSIVLKLLRCSYCDYETTRFFFLERHLKFEHKPPAGGGLDSSSEVEYDDVQCFLCSTTYQSREQLEAHKRVAHLNCDECGMDFNSAEKLKTHQREHECVCGNCKLVFENHDQWFEHWQNDHSVKSIVEDSDSDVEFIG